MSKIYPNLVYDFRLHIIVAPALCLSSFIYNTVKSICAIRSIMNSLIVHIVGPIVHEVRRYVKKARVSLKRRQQFDVIIMKKTKLVEISQRKKTRKCQSVQRNYFIARKSSAHISQS